MPEGLFNKGFQAFFVLPVETRSLASPAEHRSTRGQIVSVKKQVALLWNEAADIQYRPDGEKTFADFEKLLTWTQIRAKSSPYPLVDAVLYFNLCNNASLK